MRSDGYSTWWFVSVCLVSVRLLPRFLRLRTTRQRNSDTKKGDFRVQKLLREKQVNKPIMQILHRLTSTGPLALCTLEVYTRSHNGGRASTLACYLLL